MSTQHHPANHAGQIEIRRQLLGITQGALADLLGLTQSEIARVEQAQRKRGTAAARRTDLFAGINDGLAALEGALDQIVSTTVAAIVASHRPRSVVTLAVPIRNGVAGETGSVTLMQRHVGAGGVAEPATSWRPASVGVPRDVQRQAMAHVAHRCRELGYVVEVRDGDAASPGR